MQFRFTHASRLALRVGIALIALFSLRTQAALLHDPTLHWNSLTSTHFIVHYHDGEAAMARKALAVAEQVHTRLAPLFKWTPRSRTEIVLSDRYDGPNGYTSPFPDNRVTIYLSAPDELDSLEDHGGWLETVITHEYAHVLHLDKAWGWPESVRHVFGRFPLPIPGLQAFPNAWQPDWMLEGLATYIETDTTRGMGRGQSAYFDMLMRMEVARGIKPLTQVNQPIATWPGYTTFYLYGVEYYQFIAARYGQDKVMRLVENYSNDAVPFFINRNTRQVVGKDLTQLWDEFAIYLQQKYQPTLSAVAQQGERAGTAVTHHGYYGGAARALPDGSIVYLRNDGRSEPRLWRLIAGAKHAQPLADVHSGARFDVHPDAGVLLAQPERYRNANVFYDLYRVDLHSGWVRRLTHGARYRFATWSPDGKQIAAATSANGVQALHLLDARGKLVEVLTTMEDEAVLSELDWSPDGSNIVAAVWRRRDGWNIERFDLATRQWQSLTHDGALDGQPQYSIDGKSILYTSDAGGIYNLRRLDVASGAVTTLTNVKGGAFYPSEASDAIYYTGYNADGFDIYRLPKDELKPAPTPTVLGAGSVRVATEPPALTDVRESRYQPWSSLAPRWWFPHLGIDKDQVEVGAITAGADTLLRHAYAIDAAYDFKQKNFVGSVDYIYDRWYPLFKAHADRTDDFYRNSDGGVQRVRRDDTFQVETVLPYLFYRQDYSLHATALEQRSSDADVAPGVLAQPNKTDKLLGVALAYDSTRRYPLSISRSYGSRISFVAEDSDALRGSDYQGEVYTFDWRHYFQFCREQVFAVRFVEGWGVNNPRPFELGGSQGAPSNGVLESVVSPVTFDNLFNQRRYGLRGYPRGLPQLSDRRMLLTTAEWRFPLARVERGLMKPFPLALDTVHGAVFYDSGSVWHDGSSADKFYDAAGLELSANTILFYGLPAQLRLGYAHGFDTLGENQVYLRIGASF